MAAVSMATRETWFKVPEAIKVHLTGKLQPMVSGKDVILHLIGLIGVDGALYQSLEYCGDGVAALSMDDRLCIANMSIEAGAKNGIFEVDDVTRAYMDGRVNRPTRLRGRPPTPSTSAPWRLTLAPSSLPWPSPTCRRTPTPSPKWARSRSTRW